MRSACCCLCTARTGEEAYFCSPWPEASPSLITSSLACCQRSPLKIQFLWYAGRGHRGVNSHVLVEVFNVLPLLLQLLLDGKEPVLSVSTCPHSLSLPPIMVRDAGIVPLVAVGIRTWPSLPGECKAPRRRPRAW